MPFGLLAGAAAPAPAATVQAVLARLWRVRSENCHTKAFWLMAWPIARGVVDSIAGELAAQKLLLTPLAADHIWLADAPAGVYSGVWDVVSLAAVAAMGHGRRRMYAMSLAPPPLPPLVPVCVPLLAPVSGSSSLILLPCGVHQPHGKHTCLLGTPSSFFMLPLPLSG
ncbi:hypothetical protein ACK3TF_001931 [Chlorella vulgaris]